MDDGTTKTFTSFRIQHSTARESAKGGILFAKDETIDYVTPDFLCNAGGVTVSYFEQVQNNMNYY